ncbi:MAG: serpin family protein [Candidatus Moraniibacteriota bacterium]
MSKEFFLVMFVILAVVVFGIVYFRSRTLIPQSVSVEVDDKKATPEGVKSVVDANNQFALDLYSELKNGSGNIFFSPYGVSVALAMTYEGARGETANEIQAVSHLPADGNLRQPSFAAIYRQINRLDSKYKLSIADAVWAQNDYKFLDEYTNVLQQYYAGKATNVDFKNSTEESRQIINKWVGDKTDNKINSLFSQGSPDNTARLVLTNAIYFKGAWLKKFEKAQTKDADFRVDADNIVKVPMMQQMDKDAKFNYAETDTLQILEMPYEGDKLSMIVLLPKNDSDMSLEGSLSLENIRNWRNEFREQHVDVFMPKFTFDIKYSLKEILMRMGMPLAFTWPGADFSGMDGTKNLYIGDVVHQVSIDIDENGAEAVAATGVAVVAGSAMPQQVPTFRADHPFIFAIQDKENGSILFLGRVSNPSK